MIVRKLRLQHGWSQEQLAELSGLSVRTIQRVERGAKPGLETAKSLASVFELELSTFTSGDTEMNHSTDELEVKPAKAELLDDEKEAMQYVKGIKEFYTHLILFVVFAIVLLFIKDSENPVILWAVLGWGAGVLIHGLVAFEKIRLIGPNWEKRQVEKRIGRKL